MHDINDLEKRGIPGGYVATDQFIEAADAQSKGLGFEPAAHFIPHPVQDRTDEEMVALAQNAFVAVKAMVATS